MKVYNANKKEREEREGEGREREMKGGYPVLMCIKRRVLKVIAASL